LSLSELEQFDLGSLGVNFGLLGLSAVVLLIGYFATGYLWGLIVGDLGGPRLPAVVSVRLFMIGNLGRYVPGKVWQIAGLAILAKDRGVAAPTAAAAAILGQGIALAAALLIGLGAVWTVADGASWRWAVPAVILGATVLGLTPTVFHAVSGLWFRLARAEEPKDLSTSHAARWLALGLGSWIVYSVAFWMLVRSLGLPADVLPTASAFAAAYVLGYVMVFAPAGIGVREGFLVLLLSPQLGAGAAGAVAIIARLWTTVIEVIPAAAFWARHLATDGGPRTSE
jgi:uncharacterized membrane protein YbhN (UPF0104 family)